MLGVTICAFSRVAVPPPLRPTGTCVKAKASERTSRRARRSSKSGYVRCPRGPSGVVDADRIATSRPGSRTGSGRNSIALKMPNSAMFSPIPTASVAIATAENPGFTKTERMAYRIWGLTPSRKANALPCRSVAATCWNYRRLRIRGQAPFRQPCSEPGSGVPSVGRLINCRA